MTKRHLTQRQKHRIQQIQKLRLERAEKRLESGDFDDAQLGKMQIGQLIAHHSVYVDVESENGIIYRCNLRQNLAPLVVGDYVAYRVAKGASGVVEALEKRLSLLAKPDERGNPKPIAANLDQIIVVIAPLPKPSLSLLDSYLIAAEHVNIPIVILLNKIDLIDNQDTQTFQHLLNIYGNIGYPVYTSSLIKSQGLKQLKMTLQDKTSIFVGQSGVGKSSLINSLIPGSDVATSSISKRRQLGTHTTTTSRVFHLPFGGKIIDSPGIREFGLWHMDAADIAKGFVEFKDFLGYCKFRDCKHLHEPDCAIRAAIKAHQIAPERLHSFHTILEEIDNNKY